MHPQVLLLAAFVSLSSVDHNNPHSLISALAKDSVLEITDGLWWSNEDGVSGVHILYAVVSLSTFILYNLGSSDTKKAGS